MRPLRVALIYRKKKKQPRLNRICLVEKICYSYIFWGIFSFLRFSISRCSFLFLKCIFFPLYLVFLHRKWKQKRVGRKFFSSNFFPRRYLFFFIYFYLELSLKTKRFCISVWKIVFCRICVFLKVDVHFFYINSCNSCPIRRFSCTKK